MSHLPELLDTVVEVLFHLFALLSTVDFALSQPLAFWSITDFALAPALALLSKVPSSTLLGTVPPVTVICPFM